MLSKESRSTWDMRVVNSMCARRPPQPSYQQRDDVSLTSPVPSPTDDLSRVGMILSWFGGRVWGAFQKESERERAGSRTEERNTVREVVIGGDFPGHFFFFVSFFSSSDLRCASLALSHSLLRPPLTAPFKGKHTLSPPPHSPLTTLLCPILSFFHGHHPFVVL